MVGPAVQHMPLGVVHLLRTCALHRHESFSTTQSIQPGTPKLRAIEQSVKIGAPDQPILPHSSVQGATVRPPAMKLIGGLHRVPMEMKTGTMGTGICASHVNDVPADRHRAFAEQRVQALSHRAQPRLQRGAS